MEDNPKTATSKTPDREKSDPQCDYFDKDNFMDEFFEFAKHLADRD